MGKYHGKTGWQSHIVGGSTYHKSGGIAYRHWVNNGSVKVYYYVESLPGEGGKDWGYTSKLKNAKILSPYWQRQFLADCRHVRCLDYKIYPASFKEYAT